MELPPNDLKRAFREGRSQIGLWTQLTSPIAAEILARSGFDFLVIDTEHAPNELPLVLAQLQAMSGGTASPVVRVAWNDAVLFKRLLDVGAQTLLVPFVQNAEEARRAVAATRYPPDGIRGVAVVTRASRFGRVTGYLTRAHEELCVLVQVERRVALAGASSAPPVPRTQCGGHGPPRARNEQWSGGCQSRVAKTGRGARANTSIAWLSGAITASPPGTASAPPGRKSVLDIDQQQGVAAAWREWTFHPSDASRRRAADVDLHQRYVARRERCAVLTFINIRRRGAGSV